MKINILLCFIFVFSIFSVFSNIENKIKSKRIKSELKLIRVIPRIMRPRLIASPFTSRLWFPHFRYRWINRIHGYPKIYIKQNKRKCNSICADAFENCSNLVTKSNHEGHLRCVCKDNNQEKVYNNYCWTPKKCIKASASGCSVLSNKIKQKIDELKSQLKEAQNFE